MIRLFFVFSSVADSDFLWADNFNLLIILTLFLAWKRGFSPIDIISQKWDSAIVVALRRRFGAPARPAA
ncbi:MAG: hypothetical protein JEZ11_06595 [Desulfobacterales bacterium]|nr:hypothetical protein [Desulfobacterales bacterium]